jgi:phosphoribosyl-ATP pyrophosphohydrolase/phosphoribosyl-AMP cyclohydrolase
MQELVAQIDFSKGDGLVPTVVQDARTGKVLMLGYMNREAVEKTRETGKVTFFSRSKERLWTKGETSGNFLHLVELKLDCDQDTLLVKARPDGPTCHTGQDTCFNETNTSTQFLYHLEQVIRDRSPA